MKRKPWLPLATALFTSTSLAQPLPPPPVSPAPVTNYEYDAEGHLTKVIKGPGTNGLNLSTAHTYDTLNRLKATTDPQANPPVQFGYDGQDQPLKITDPRRLDTRYVRNGFGEVTQITSPDTGTTDFTYDPSSNLQTATDSRGVLARFDYDAMDRRTSAVFSQAAATAGPTAPQAAASTPAASPARASPPAARTTPTMPGATCSPPSSRSPPRPATPMH
jgi:YD repeat-containing protein